MQTPQSVGAMNGAPTFTIKSDQMPALKGQRSGHECSFTLRAKIVSVDKDGYTLQWQSLSLPDTESDEPRYKGMSDFKKAAYAGEMRTPNKVIYVQPLTGPAPS